MLIISLVKVWTHVSELCFNILTKNFFVASMSKWSLVEWEGELIIGQTTSITVIVTGPVSWFGLGYATHIVYLGQKEPVGTYLSPGLQLVKFRVFVLQTTCHTKVKKPTIYLLLENNWAHTFPKSISAMWNANSIAPDLNSSTWVHFPWQ